MSREYFRYGLGDLRSGPPSSLKSCFRLALLPYAIYSWSKLDDGKAGSEAT